MLFPSRSLKPLGNFSGISGSMLFYFLLKRKLPWRSKSFEVQRKIGLQFKICKH